jgi:hypothetical protein
MSTEPSTVVQPCPFAVELRLRELMDDDLLRVLDNSHGNTPDGEWRDWRYSKVRFELRIRAHAGFRAERTELAVWRGGEELFSETFTDEKVTAGQHEWRWESRACASGRARRMPIGCTRWRGTSMPRP